MLSVSVVAACLSGCESSGALGSGWGSRDVAGAAMAGPALVVGAAVLIVGAPVMAAKEVIEYLSGPLPWDTDD